MTRKGKDSLYSKTFEFDESINFEEVFIILKDHRFRKYGVSSRSLEVTSGENTEDRKEFTVMDELPVNGVVALKIVLGRARKLQVNVQAIPYKRLPLTQGISMNFNRIDTSLDLYTLPYEVRPDFIEYAKEVATIIKKNFSQHLLNNKRRTKAVNAEPVKQPKRTRTASTETNDSKRGANANTESKVREAHKRLKSGTKWATVRKICSYETYIKWCESVTGEPPITKH